MTLAECMDEIRSQIRELKERVTEIERLRREQQEYWAKLLDALTAESKNK